MPRTTPAAQWLTLQEAAAIYAVSVKTLRRRLACGDLPASRCGTRLIRVRADDLDALFRQIPSATHFPTRTANRRQAS